MEQKVIEQIQRVAYENWEKRNQLKIAGDQKGDWLAAVEAVVNKNPKFLAGNNGKTEVIMLDTNEVMKNVEQPRRKSATTRKRANQTI